MQRILVIGGTWRYVNSLVSIASDNFLCNHMLKWVTQTRGTSYSCYVSNNYKGDLHGLTVWEYNGITDLMEKIKKYPVDFFDLVIQFATFEEFHCDEKYISTKDLFQRVFMKIARTHSSMDDCTMEELLACADEVLREKNIWKSHQEDLELVGTDVIGVHLAAPSLYNFLHERFPKARIVGSYVEMIPNRNDSDQQIKYQTRDFAKRFHLDSMIYVNNLRTPSLLGVYTAADNKSLIQRGELMKFHHPLFDLLNMYTK